MAEPKTVRCAVYTRKSTEDGLDQAFNSLDAQYEACAAYAVSQKHEGWSLAPERYDDGGFSGGNMERPSFKRLLANVAAGKIDVILIYKIDRLTRSLTDFSRIVDVLDTAGASFVSITQSFNTRTSMGRLTLNMLLSFAQFEREVTGERIRDKIAASKRKGLWMGGPVPLGYDVVERKLVVNEEEAERVRHIMRRYCELGSVRVLVDELAAEGHLTKVQGRTSGPHRGGIAFQRGTLFHMLKNRIYLGEIVHKGTNYPGEHDPIVDQELWHRVQKALAERGSGEAKRTGAPLASLLIGKISDGFGRPMTPTHASKGPRRYRYYVTRPDQLGDNGQAWRVPAADLEAIVYACIVELLLDKARLHDVIANATRDPRALELGLRTAALKAATLRDGSSLAKSAIANELVERVTLEDSCIRVFLTNDGLLRLLDLNDDAGGTVDEPITLRGGAVRSRRGGTAQHPATVSEPCDAAQTRRETLQIDV